MTPRLTLVAMLLAPASGSTDAGQGHWGGQEATAYRALIEKYMSGDTGPAVTGIAALPRGSLLQVAEDVARPESSDAILFRAAAILHTDVAESYWIQHRDDPANFHLQLARRWVDAAEGSQSANGSFRRRWYLGSSLLLARNVVLVDAARYFDGIVEAMSDDVPFLTAAAWLREYLAFTRPSMAGVDPRGLENVQGRKREYLRDAARLLTAALKVDPTAVEPALRLARVRFELGEDVQAREQLAGLIARRDLLAPDIYLAHLLLGGLHERRGEMDAAAGAYAKAIAVLPSGQSARLALALIQYRNPDSGDKAEIVEAFMARGGTERNDPWSDYLARNVERGPSIIAELRAEVQR